jgi:hypothetical protein
MDLLRTEVSEEHVASVISVTGISELGTTLEVTINLLDIANDVPSSLISVTVMMEAIRSSETSVLTGATRYYIP